MKKLTLLLFAFCFTLAQAQEVETYPFVQRDSTLFLDVYRPAQAREDKACVLAVFGGGFVGGERNNGL